jgi:tRNA threonylcarbamoyladenosine biosynthesis protein TsaB
VKPVILSLDTTREFGSIAWLGGGEVLDEELLHAPEGFGQMLFDRIQRLLERRNRLLGDVDCFAAASGPGSFTGVRVGLACVMGLAEALDRKVAAVSNLETLSRFGSAAQRAVVLDARRGEIYGALYGPAGEVLREPVVSTLPAWLDTLPAGEIEFLSTDFAPFQSALQGTRFENAAITTAPRALAAAVGRIARERFLAGLAHDPAAVDADYVRRSDAELLWKDR